MIGAHTTALAGHYAALASCEPWQACAMKQLALVAFVLACNKPDEPAIPKAPDPKEFAARSADMKCAAITPRAEPCADEIMQQTARVLFGSDANPLNEGLAAQAKATVKEAHLIIQQTCLGDAKFADRVLSCWQAPTCKELARCSVVAP